LQIFSIAGLATKDEIKFIEEREGDYDFYWKSDEEEGPTSPDDEADNEDDAENDDDADSGDNTDNDDNGSSPDIRLVREFKESPPESWWLFRCMDDPSLWYCIDYQKRKRIFVGPSASKAYIVERALFDVMIWNTDSDLDDDE
jgi:hypothetical protein